MFPGVARMGIVDDARNVMRWTTILLEQANILFDRDLWEGNREASYHHAGVGVMLSTTKLPAEVYR